MTNQLATAPAMQPLQPIGGILSETAAILNMIERASRDSSVDIDKLKQLLEMREKIEERAAQREFNEALSRVQEATVRIVADKENNQTRSRYASFAALDREIRPIYSRLGFNLSFDTGETGSTDEVRIMCHVSHSSGHTKTHHIDMPADGLGAKGSAVMTKIHARGSAVSYGRRYLLIMIFNLAISLDADDDGNAAGGELITEEQALELQKGIEETGSDIAKFLKYFQAADLGLIKAKDFPRAVSALNQKGKKAE